MNQFEGKVVLVTGGSSGIGLAISKAFAAEKARIVIASRSVESAVVEEVKAAGANAVLPVNCDVSKEEEVIDCVGRAMHQFGALDVLVNNAGVMIFKPIEEHTGADFLKVLSVDLLGAFYFTKLAFRHMKPGGAIVNIASIHAVETSPLVSAYAAAKAALLSFTRSTALEGKAKGIRANAILPGAIDTPMLWENPNVKSGAEVVDRADVGKPGDIAAVCLFLASPQAAFVQGASLIVDGGRLGKL